MRECLARAIEISEHIRIKAGEHVNCEGGGLDLNCIPHWTKDGTPYCCISDLDNWIRDWYCTSSPLFYLKKHGMSYEDASKVLGGGASDGEWCNVNFENSGIRFPYPGHALKSSLDWFIEKHKPKTKYLIWIISYRDSPSIILAVYPENETPHKDYTGLRGIMSHGPLYDSYDEAIDAAVETKLTVVHDGAGRKCNEVKESSANER